MLWVCLLERMRGSQVFRLLVLVRWVEYRLNHRYCLVSHRRGDGFVLFLYVDLSGCAGVQTV